MANNKSIVDLFSERYLEKKSSRKAQKDYPTFLEKKVRDRYNQEWIIRGEMGNGNRLFGVVLPAQNKKWSGELFELLNINFPPEVKKAISDLDSEIEQKRRREGKKKELSDKKVVKYKGWDIIWDWYGSTTKAKIRSPRGWESTNFGKGYTLDEAKAMIDHFINDKV